MRFFKLFIILFPPALIALACVFTPAAFAADDVSDFDKLARFRNEFTSPFEDVTPDHWAYKAVKRLADKGLLEGYEGKDFLGNKVVTRYELAILISRLVDNYIEVQSRGSLTERRQVVAPVKSAAIAPSSLAGTPPGEVAYRRIAPTETIIVPSAPGAPPTAAGPAGVLMRRGPLTLEELARAAAKGPEPLEVRFEEIEKKIQLTQKDTDELQKLIDAFGKELKDINKSFKKELSEGKKITLKNERDIKKLQDENERFNVTGENDFLVADLGATHGREKASSGDPRDVMRQMLLVDALKLNIKSKPNPTEDLTLGAQLISDNTLTGNQFTLYEFAAAESIGIGGTMGAAATQRDLMLGRKYRDKSQVYLNEVYVNYNNTTEDPKHPKNFKLRTMNLGEISLNYSPLTLFMTNFPGAKLEFKLNKYTMSLFGARVARHPTSWFFSELYLSGWPRNDDTTRFFDRYVFGGSVSFPLFGETRSMTNVTKIFLYDDSDTPYPGCLGNYGQWVEIMPDYDLRSIKGPTTNLANKDIFCLPPEKNSVTSFFTRYPLIKNVWLTGEFAHSTYFREGYQARKLGATQCDRLGTTGSINCFDIPEKDQHDEAFLILLDYSKPPIKMFPVGYAKLGTEFVTKYLGLPGFDMSSMGVGFLPINIQSMGLFISNFGVDRLTDKNYSYETYFITGRELEAGGINFDVGELLASMSTNDQKTTISEVLPKPINFINNRTTKMGLNVWMNKFKYNLSEKISMKAEYTDVKMEIPPSCLDNNLVSVRDEGGTTVDVLYGDGVSLCASEGGLDSVEAFGINYDLLEQKYILDWKTSKNTDFEGTFKISDSALSFKYDPQVESIINDLAPQGKYYMFHGQVLHKLTSSTELKLGYQTYFDVYPDSDDSGDPSIYPVIDSDAFYFNVNTKF